MSGEITKNKDNFMKYLMFLILLIPSSVQALTYEWNVTSQSLFGKFYALGEDINLYGDPTEPGLVRWHEGTVSFDIPFDFSVHQYTKENEELPYFRGEGTLQGILNSIVTFDPLTGFLEGYNLVVTLNFATNETANLDFGNWGWIPINDPGIEFEIRDGELRTEFTAWNFNEFSDGQVTGSASYIGEVQNPEPMSLGLLGLGLFGLRRCQRK